MPPELSDLLGTGALSARRGTVAVPMVLETQPVSAETVRATVLFVDLRGYTALAERLAPVDVVTLLDEFFAVLGAATERHGGEIFYMVGDGMMAGFGVRDRSADGARPALAAAQAMLRGVTPLVDRWRRDLGIETGIGVGLHLGEVALGLHGPPTQRARTLIGDTVNVAARLCSRARAGEVLFSAAVAAALHSARLTAAESTEPLPFLHLPQFALRGRTCPLDIWCMPAEERVTL